MYAGSKWSKNTDSPVAELVAHALDDDVAIIWHRYGCNLLIGQKSNEILGGLRIEIVLTHQSAKSGVARHLAQLADKRADAPTEFKGTAGDISVPERHLPRLAGSG